MELENKKNTSNEIDLVAILRLGLRKWYILVTIFAVCILLGVFYYVKTTPQYQTQATILIRTEDAMNPLKGMNFDGFISSDILGGTKAVDDEIEVLRSKSFVEQMIEELDIRTDVYWQKGLRNLELFGGEPIKIVYPENFERSIQGSLVIKVKKSDDGLYKVSFIRKKGNEKERFSAKLKSLRERIKTPWGTFGFVEFEDSFLSSANYKEGYTLTFKITSLKSQIDRYNSSIGIKLVSKKANVVALSLTSYNANKNEAILNKLIDIYNLGALTDKNKMSMQMIAFTTERLAVISEELKEAEQAVESYRRQNNIANIEAQSQLFLETSSEYEKRIAEMDIQYSLVAFVENYLKNATSKDLIPNNTGIEDESLGELIISYNDLVLQYLRILRSSNDTNPIVAQNQHQIQLLRENILLTIRNVKKSIEITKSDLADKNKLFTAKIGDVPTLEREFIDVSRQQRIKQTLYMSLLQKREEAQLSLASSTSTAKIIDSAYTAESPVSPNLKIAILFAILMAGALSGVYLYIHTLLNDRVQDKQELKQLTDLPIIGYIPYVKGTSYVVMTSEKHGVIDEMFRSVRANLKFVLKHTDDKVMLVTSSIAGEGKSFFSINLALSLAFLNKRVALVGLDIRKPMLANYLNLHNGLGVTNYLSDHSLSLADIVTKSSYDTHLDVIIGGTIPPNPAELLNDPRLDELFIDLRAHYDYIIIDSAPIGLVSDTFLINHVADAVLYVTRQLVTPREYIHNLESFVQEGKLSNVSLVLNGVPESDLYGYGYVNYVQKTK